jgi:hypothetical protein
MRMMNLLGATDEDPQPTQRVADQPAWSTPGFSPLTLIAFDGGSLMIQGSSSALDQLLAQLRFSGPQR